MDAMLTCPTCNEPVPPAATECPNCGAVLSVEPPPIEEETVRDGKNRQESETLTDAEQLHVTPMQENPEDRLSDLEKQFAAYFTDYQRERERGRRETLEISALLNALDDEIEKLKGEVGALDLRVSRYDKADEISVRGIDAKTPAVERRDEVKTHQSAPAILPLSLSRVKEYMKVVKTEVETAGFRLLQDFRWRKWIPIGILVFLLGAGLSVGGGLLSLGTQGVGPLAGLATNTATPIATPTATVTRTPGPTFTPTATPYPAQITDSKGIQMALVPAGEFTMGSEDGDSDEEPVHQVYLDAFYMDIYEVTNAAYRACMNADACDPPHRTSSDSRSNYYGNVRYDNYPVINVDWHQAEAYCEWRGARLPTEAEWEKAARGADGRLYPWGKDLDCSKANYGNCNRDTTEVTTYSSGKSPYGMYDMAGNVWEWVADWYFKYYYANSPFSNPLGPVSGDSRALRGGSWSDDDNSVRASDRSRDDPAYWNDHIGFRCSRSP